MSNIVLTSLNRTIGLPVKISELKKEEQVVATSAEFGMLYLMEGTDGKEILRDYDEFEEGEIPEGGVPICLPLIEDYKKTKINKLVNEINDIQNIEGTP